MSDAYRDFWALAHSVVDGGKRALVLEKVARGAGQTSWFLLTHTSHVDKAMAASRGGSALLLYIDPQFAIEGSASPDLLSAVQGLLTAIRVPDQALVALAPRPDSPVCEYDFPTSLGDVREWFDDRPGTRVLLRKYPALDEEDAEAIVPDADGVARAYPH